MNLRKALPGICLSAILAMPALASAQSYPTRLVRTIVSFPAGTTVDNVIRLYTPKLAEAYGQPFIVENRIGGAAGNVGAEFVARAPADGYTLLAAAASIPSSISLYKDLGFDFVRDFDPIAMLASSPFLLVATNSAGVSTVPELIKLAKGKPGQLNFASTGIGGTNHLAGELFNSMAGVKFVHVPYKGTGTALPDVVNGNVAMMFAAVGVAQPLAKAGRLRVLAISSAARSPLAPDVPTVAEAGVPGYEATTWFALLAPAKTPQEIVTRLNGAIVKLNQTAEIRERLAAQGADPLNGTPQQVSTFIKSEVVKWAKVVSDAGVKAE